MPSNRIICSKAFHKWYDGNLGAVTAETGSPCANQGEGRLVNTFSLPTAPYHCCLLVMHLSVYAPVWNREACLRGKTIPPHPPQTHTCTYPVCTHAMFSLNAQIHYMLHITLCTFSSHCILAYSDVMNFLWSKGVYKPVHCVALFVLWPCKWKFLVDKGKWQLH